MTVPSICLRGRQADRKKCYFSCAVFTTMEKSNKIKILSMVYKALANIKTQSIISLG
jgi:hypothetical protein